MKRTLIILAILFGSTVIAAAQSPVTALEQRLRIIVQRSQALGGAAVGVSVRDMSGAEVAGLNSAQRMVPASNMKLITTGTALHTLGAEYRFKTSIGYTGAIDGGTLNGDLYIIGGGDPTTAVDNMEEVFASWKSILDGAGISRIQGRIIGDQRAWEGFLELGDWTYEDVGTYYGTGAGALNFYKNAIDLKVAAGEAEGAPVQAVQAFPQTPWMHSANSSLTGPEGTGNSLYLYTTDLAPYAELRGSFALDRAPKTEHFANKFGALTCAYYFRKYLSGNGISVTGNAADIDRGGYIREADFTLGEKAGEPKIIGGSRSVRLGDIVRETNFESDNFYAEAIFRTMGEEATGCAVYDSSGVAEKSALKSLGLRTEDLTIMDGSGLSRRNAVSAGLMTRYLNAMACSPAFPSFLQSLPMPGEGTLSSLLKDRPGAARYRLKSGSMEGVLCYSGYLLADDGTPLASVSVLVNGTNAGTAKVRKALEDVLRAIAENLLSL